MAATFYQPLIPPEPLSASTVWGTTDGTDGFVSGWHVEPHVRLEDTGTPGFPRTLATEIRRKTE